MTTARSLTGPLPATLRPSGAGARRPWPLRLLTALGRTLMTWQQRAAERQNLSRLSDHHLKDVGLSRAQVEHELAKAFWRP